MKSPYDSFLSDDGSFMSPGSDGNTPLPGASVQTASTPSPQDSMPVQATQPMVSSDVRLDQTDSTYTPPPPAAPPKDNTKLYLGIAAAVLVGYFLLKKKH